MSKTIVTKKAKTTSKSAGHSSKKPTVANKQSPKARLPKDVPLLGETFNFLYKDLFALVSDIAGSNGKKDQNSSNIDILVDLARFELRLAVLRKQENYQNYLSQPKRGNSEFKQLFEQRYKYFATEIAEWRDGTGKVDLLLGHLYMNDRWQAIFPAHEHLRKSYASESPKDILDLLMQAITLTELANANAMAKKGNIKAMAESLYEATMAHKIWAVGVSQKISKRDLKRERSKNGTKGAAPRSKNLKDVRAYVAELAAPFGTKSANSIAFEIKDKVIQKARQFNVVLSEANAQRTIRDYILDHRKSLK
jgi:hypothetical protein